MNAATPATVHDVRVWNAAVPDRGTLSFRSLTAHASGDELGHSESFNFERDRRAYLAAHGLLRHALSSFEPRIAPREWAFVAGPHGRPEVAPGLSSRVRFNLSHCESRVACLVCRDLDCGIDVEPRQRRRPGAALTEHSLSREERAWVAQAGAEARTERFLRLWTLKEAVAKAVGLGLALPFDELTFDLAGDPVLRRAPEPALGTWWLRQSASHDHFEALALRVAEGDAVALVREQWSA